MDLVVDANVLFAAMIGRDKTMELFFEEKIRLLAPTYLLYELENNRVWLAKSCGMSLEEFTELLERLKSKIELFPLSTISSAILAKAQELAPHKKDVPYFALALHLGCAIWSREAEFKAQKEVKVYATEELVDMFLKE